MSQDNPTPEELDSILQLQNGSYGVEPPDWWPVLPAAKPALYQALYEHYKHNGAA